MFADIRTLAELNSAVSKFQPEIVFHPAAQSLVRHSYLAPIETYQVNVMGTVHMLEAVRTSRSCRVVVVVTSDKCYENKEWSLGVPEGEAMGGFDPYSSSKGCAELMTSAYRRSYFSGDRSVVAWRALSAGNVIGGGDFAKERLIPDLMASIRRRETLKIRCPNSVQALAARVGASLRLHAAALSGSGTDHTEYPQGWNFGPSPGDTRSVQWIVERVERALGRRIQRGRLDDASRSARSAITYAG